MPAGAPWLAAFSTPLGFTEGPFKRYKKVLGLQVCVAWTVLDRAGFAVIPAAGGAS